MSWLRKLFKPTIIDCSKVKPLQEQIQRQKEQLLKLASTLLKHERTIGLLKGEKADLLEALETSEEKALKKFLNNNRWHAPSSNKTHLNKKLNYWCNEDNDQTPTVEGNSFDDKANNALIWVAQNIDYTRDEKEYWQTANQTIDRGKGDCEDGAILMYNILIKSGVPVHRVRLNAGWVWDGKGEFPKDLNTGTPSSFTQWYLQKEINCGNIQTQLINKLKKENVEELKQSLRKVASLGIKEREPLDKAFANMDGKLLKTVNNVVEGVKKKIKANYAFTTKTKTDETTNLKILKYYVLLAMRNIMEKKETEDSLGEVLDLGITDLKRTSGQGGHAYITYYSDKNGWVILDWCYWFSESVYLQKRWTESKKYFGVWFSWNSEYVWLDIEDNGML